MEREPAMMAGSAMSESTRLLLDEVADPSMNPEDLAHTYAWAICEARESTDWGRVNRAIVERWGSRWGPVRCNQIKARALELARWRTA